MTQSPPDLLEQVLHAIEGEETEQRVAQLKDGAQETIEVRYFGPDKWIEKVHERGILTPLQFLAIVHFALWDLRTPAQNERRIVDGWYRVLIASAEKREVVPRDRDSLLPLDCVDDWNSWVLSVADADSLVAANGMEWSCTDVISHLHQQSMPPHAHLLAALNKLGSTTDVPPASSTARNAIGPPLAGDDVAPATDDDWIARARELAQAIGEEIWRVGVRQVTARGLSERVATELGKESRYHGMQGPRSASNVRNSALKGWKFAPPE